MKHDIAAQSVAATPPAAVSILATAQGWNMADWVALATVLYIGLQAAYLCWKWWREYKAK